MRRDLVDRDFVGKAEDVGRLDARIATALEDLLRTHASPGESVRGVGALLGAVRETLDRPGAVLQRMKEEKQEHFFYQYLDQTADPEFSSLFDKYRRTSASATAKRRVMEEEMRTMISLRFVDARREQIRGYGYDEFAIFAELVQNAEDAYSQRDQLELAEPPGRGVAFTYSVEDGGRSLSASHYGRPFNLWRHGAKRVDAFRYDVRRSSEIRWVVQGAQHDRRREAGGPFRPRIQERLSGYRHATHPLWRLALRDHRGLHSQRSRRPSRLRQGTDADRSALDDDAREERDGERGRYANLLPFLRNVQDLRVEYSDGTSLSLRTTSRRILHTTDGYQADYVEIRGATHVLGDTIRLLRVRHDGHEGQLGLLLGSDRLPVGWSDVFDSDVFAVLPLRVRLGCGLGVSNLFEVQSGRTHLIDPATNRERIVEVTGGSANLGEGFDCGRRRPSEGGDEPLLGRVALGRRG